MKKVQFLMFLCFGLFTSLVVAQNSCEVKSKVLPDGSMSYYFEPVTFYTTKSKSLKINLLTDDENFFIALRPTPFPKKEEGNKFKNDLKIELANDKWYILKHYDTQYLKQDSILQIVYLIDKDYLEDFKNYEAVVASINMEGTEFVRDYAFKLHKKAIMQQLECYFESKKKKSSSNTN